MYFVLQQQRFEVLKCYFRFGSYLFFYIQPLSTTLKINKNTYGKPEYQNTKSTYICQN
jgi:hypothetical protein